MKTTQSEIALSPKLTATIENIKTIRARRDTLDAVTNAMPQTIADLKVKAASIADSLATKEGNLALLSGTEAKKLEGEYTTQGTALAVAEVEVNRAEAKLEALETKIAPEIDAAMKEAEIDLTREISIDADERKARIAIELREAVKPILKVLAKARAANFTGQFNDLFMCAYVPDVDGFKFFGGSHSLADFVGKNLLSEASSTPEAEEIKAILAPAREAIVIAKSYQPYVPLSKRPAPYQIKGSSEGPGGRPSLPPPRDVKPAVEANSSFVKSQYSSFNLEAKPQPQELNLAPALAELEPQAAVQL